MIEIHIMNSYDKEVIEVYLATCRSFQLRGAYVLHSFANSLSIPDYLFAGFGTAEHCASKVFSVFVKRYSPASRLNPVKRMRGIFHMRRILKVNRSFCTNEEKLKAYDQICNNWYLTNDVQGEGRKLFLHDNLWIKLPKGLLLLCDLFRCQPDDLLNYFIEEIILEMDRPTTDGPAIQFLIHCVTDFNNVKDN